MQYYVYILRCEDNSLYTGITTDVKRRFKEHTSDRLKGAKYTKAHKPIKIEGVWEAESKSNALKLEHHIKKLTKSEKEHIIEKDYEPCELFGIQIKRIYV